MRRSLFRIRATRLRKASDRASLWMPDVAAAMVPLAGRQQPILKRTTNDLADYMLLALEAKPGIGRLTRRRTKPTDPRNCASARGLHPAGTNAALELAKLRIVRRVALERLRKDQTTRRGGLRSSSSTRCSSDSANSRGLIWAPAVKPPILRRIA